MESFVCKRCGRCCTGEGFVNVTEEECRGIAGFLHLSLEAFLATHTVGVEGYPRSLLDAKEEDLPCIFLQRDPDGLSSCRIHQAKPRQCRDFPVRWRRADAKEWCAGLAAHATAKSARS